MPKAGDRYRHFKSGGIYRIVTLFTWEPTKEPAVLYQSEDTDEQWGRPLSVFMAEVTDPNDPSKQVRRFQPLADEAVSSELKS